MKNKKVTQIMTKHPITVSYEEPIQKASELMMEHHFRHLPVTDQLGDVIGILSDRDVQRAIEVKRMGAEMEYVIAPHRKVKDFMSWPPQTIADDSNLLDALELVIDRKISALLVQSVQTGKTRGILTSEDLLKEFSKILKQEEDLPMDIPMPTAFGTD